MAKQSEVFSLALTAEMPIPGERRTEYRRPVDMAGVCEFDDGTERLECTIVDMTSAGAQLRVASDATVPNDFKLYVLPLNTILDCRVAWRLDTRVGVSYTTISENVI
ncbi:MAG: PilZ domain-containing protein [Aestuariivirgaceae bacterium]